MRIISLCLIIQTLLGCNQSFKLKINLKDNNCLQNEQLDYFPTSTNYFISTELKIEITEQNTQTKLFTIKNTSQDTISFFDIDVITQNYGFDTNKKGSLWINENSESSQFLDCIKRNKYSITLSKFDNLNIITLKLYNGLELIPNQEFDIEIKFNEPGTYQLLLIYEGTKNKQRSVWGLNKLNQIISEKFIIR
jgi:hypothetical protein